MNLARVLVPALALVLASSAAGAQAGSRAALDSARTEVLLAEAAFADSVFREGLARVLPRRLAQDGVYLHPRVPVLRGRQAVREFFAAQPDSAVPPFRSEPLHAEVSADGRSAFVYGVTATVIRMEGGTWPRVGRFIAFWTKRGGRWEMDARLHAGPGEPGLVVPAEADPLPALAAGQDAAGRAAAADAAFAAMAGASGSGPAFRRYAAPDAVMFGGFGQMIRGPDEIGRALESRDAWTWRPVAAGAAASGDLAWTVGESRITPAGGRSSPYLGKYLTVWKRQPDGSWRFVTDGGTARPREPQR